MDNQFYRAVWRWHFYAGLIVLPVLVWLAVTGGLYLYKPEIERAVYREWIELAAPAQAMPLGEMIGRVEQASGAKVTQVARPAAADESWRMTLAAPDGETRTAFVDPASGALLGTTSKGGVMEVVKTLHSLTVTGTIGNALVEIVAGWTILLVLSGFYLWWPRRGGRALALRGKPRERRFWRDLHASAGAVVGLVVLFLAVTGLPWSVFTGEQLHRAVEAGGAGRPAAPSAAAPAGDDHQAHLPWSMQRSAPPHGGAGGDIGPQRAMALAEARGMSAPWMLAIPAAPGAPYQFSRAAERANEAHVLYLDAASGAVLQDAAYAGFGGGAQAIEWGIYTHQGQQYGEINRLVMLTGCIGVLLLAASAPIMWWKRRRRGRLDAPPSASPRQTRVVAALMVAGGVLLPLTGLTMLAALAGEMAWRRWGPGPAGAAA